MAGSKEYELAIKMAEEIEKAFIDCTKTIKEELENLSKQASTTSERFKSAFYKSFDDLDKGFNKISKVASKTFNAVKKAAEAAASTVTEIAVASTDVGMSFESSFAGVKRTTEATAEEYAKLRKGILDLSRSNIPATANEIAEVAEAAGQLGIEKENLLDFTKVMIDLGETTNLTAIEGASELARFANITQMSADKYSNLGSAIVELGNNFAVTEADIVKMANNLAASGELIGLSESQIMALATAMSSIGIEAEAGGSAMSGLLKNIQTAVETGNKSLGQFASVAGMTSKEFKEAFDKDAVFALSSFTDGLNDVERNGSSAKEILDKMGLTEVGLSDMIVGLANSEGLMTKAINISNEAWEENSALADEAAQVYATNESKIKIFKNSITGMGIQLYEEYSEPLGKAIVAGTEFVNNLSDNVIPGLIEGFKEKLPTIIRNIKEFASSFVDFAEPVISLGGWLIKNPDAIVSAFVGIGSAMTTYKIASGIKSLVKAFSGLSAILTNPLALAIAGVALAIGGAAGIASYIKKANEEMKKQNLAEHFGDISLSMEDLQKVASHIIQTDSLGKLSQAMDAMDEMENIAGSIDRTVQDLNRMNWKVGIGMELTEEEKQAYQSKITSYIAGVQEMVTQKQYAVTLAVGVLMGESDLENSNVITQINNFYTNKQKELSDLGTKLNETVTNAFQDGFLDIDEIKEITELQNKMAKIQSAIAGSQFDAQLELLNMKYSGADLDPETFKNLQVELGEQVKAASADYEEALILGMANAKLMLDEGSIDTNQYNEQIEQLKEGYLQQVGELELKAMDFQVGTIMSQYSDEINAVLPGFEKAMDDSLQNATEYINDGMDNMGGNFNTLLSDAQDFKGLDKTTKSTLKDLFDLLNPTIEQINQTQEKYKEFGIEMPKSIVAGLNDAAIIGALVGKEDSIWTVYGKSIANNEEYTKAIEKVKQSGSDIPEELAKSIDGNKAAVNSSISELYSYSQTYFEKVFSSGINVKLPITLESMIIRNSKLPEGSAAWSEKRWNEYRITGHADGGIFNSPHLAWFAEKGPEAAIPLDKSSNAIGLWKKVGKLLGVYDQERKDNSFESLISNNNESGFGSLLNKLLSKNNMDKSNARGGLGNINYSPSFNFYGGTPSKEDMVEAARISQEEFNEKMERWMHRRDRMQFA